MYSSDPLLAILIAVSAAVIPVIVAITFHEAAHGFVANQLGDDTAKRLGRVTFNPLKHISLRGTILLPGLLLIAHLPILGWAKPVPVDFTRLGHPRRDMVLVAAAGPAINIVLAFLCLWAMIILIGQPDNPTRHWIYQSFEFGLFTNISMALFNLLPLPPLDGGRIAVELLPAPLAIRWARLEKFGFPIIILAFYGLPRLGPSFDPGHWLRVVSYSLAHLMARLLGAE